MSEQPLIRMQGIRKSYYIGEPNELEILHGIDLIVDEGQFVSIVGQSGSGKSTLMNIIGALDRPTAGSYTLNGLNIAQAHDAELSGIRNRLIVLSFKPLTFWAGLPPCATLNCPCSTPVFLLKNDANGPNTF